MEITSQHGLLLFGSADEAADALDHLTLGLHLLVFALFWQEHDWRRRRRSKSLKGKRAKTCSSGSQPIVMSHRVRGASPPLAMAPVARDGLILGTHPSYSSPWSPPSWTWWAEGWALHPLVAAG